MEKIIGKILVIIGVVGFLAVIFYMLCKIWIGLAIILMSFILTAIGEILTSEASEK